MTRFSIENHSTGLADMKSVFIFGSKRLVRFGLCESLVCLNHLRICYYTELRLMLDNQWRDIATGANFYPNALMFPKACEDRKKAR